MATLTVDAVLDIIVGYENIKVVGVQIGPNDWPEVTYEGSYSALVKFIKEVYKDESLECFIKH